MARTGLQLTFGVLGVLAVLLGLAFLLTNLVRRVDDVPAWMGWLPAIVIVCAGVGLVWMSEVLYKPRGPGSDKDLVG